MLSDLTSITPPYLSALRAEEALYARQLAEVRDRIARLQATDLAGEWRYAVQDGPTRWRVIDGMVQVSRLGGWHLSVLSLADFAAAVGRGAYVRAEAVAPGTDGAR